MNHYYYTSQWRSIYSIYSNSIYYLQSVFTFYQFNFSLQYIDEKSAGSWL